MEKPFTEIDFPLHFKSISVEQWAKLFDILPEIYSTKDYGQMAKSEKIAEGVYSFPHYNYSSIAIKFIDIVYELNLIINFNWMEWNEGIKIMNERTEGFDDLDSVTLCKLITTIVRADRFNEGLLITNFNNGTIFKILEALKFQVL